MGQCPGRHTQGTAKRALIIIFIGKIVVFTALTARQGWQSLCLPPPEKKPKSGFVILRVLKTKKNRKARQYCYFSVLFSMDASSLDVFYKITMLNLVNYTLNYTGKWNLWQ